MTLSLLQTGEKIPQPRRAERSFGVWAGAYQSGAAYEHSHIWAKTEAEAEAAADYFREVTKPGMSTEERIDRAIILIRAYGAEVRHQLRANAEPHPSWVA